MTGHKMKATDYFKHQIPADYEGIEAFTRLLRIMLTVSLTAISLAIIVRFFDDKSLSVVDITLVILFTALTVSFTMLKKPDLFFPGTLLFIISVWISMTFLAARFEGINDVSITAYLLLIYLATLLTGYRIAIAVTAMSIVSIWTMAILEQKGLIIPERDLPVYYARDFTFFLIIVITTVILFERRFSFSYKRLQTELQVRRETENKLSENEKKLIEQNRSLLEAKVKAEESDRLKTAFLQNISHEIRSPMHSIVGLSELMKMPGVTQKERIDYIGRMIGYSDQLATLIDDLITISKIETGAVEICNSRFRAGSLLEEAYNLYARKAEDKGINFEMFNDLGEVIINSDRLKLFQVLKNITDNAVKFTSRGSVSIRGSVRKNLLILSVEDTGTGIEKEKIPSIFEYFRKPETGIARLTEGPGLGLSICRGNLKYMNGEINVKSEPGKGTVVTVSVPVDIID
jgi:signal transduction histidine kinase